MDKSKKSADFSKEPAKTNAPEMSDSDLDKVSGGFIGSYIKVPSKPTGIDGIDGESSDTSLRDGIGTQS